MSKDLLGQLTKQLTIDSVEDLDNQSDAISFSSIENPHKTWEERSLISKELLDQLIEQLPWSSKTNTHQLTNENVARVYKLDKSSIRLNNC